MILIVHSYVVVAIQDCLVEDLVWGDLVDPLGSPHGLLDRLLGELGAGNILGGQLLRGVRVAPLFLVRAVVGR